LLAINVRSFENLECFGASFRYSVILLSGTAAHSHAADHFSGARQRDAAAEHHHAPMVGHLDSEELTARLRILREILRRNIEGTTTAMFMGLLISLAFRSAASITLRPSTSVTVHILSEEEECNHHSNSGLHVSR
jgi:hypothetical protein